jgi:hypothetical protein
LCHHLGRLILRKTYVPLGSNQPVLPVCPASWLAATQPKYYSHKEVRFGQRQQECNNNTTEERLWHRKAKLFLSFSFTAKICDIGTWIIGPKQKLTDQPKGLNESSHLTKTTNSFQ